MGIIIGEGGGGRQKGLRDRHYLRSEKGNREELNTGGTGLHRVNQDGGLLVRGSCVFS